MIIMSSQFIIEIAMSTFYPQKDKINPDKKMEKKKQTKKRFFFLIL